MLSSHIARSRPIKAVYIAADYALNTANSNQTHNAVVVIEGFQPKLMNYTKIIDKTCVVLVAVDMWVFERDVERGFLGEAVAYGLLFPYTPLKGDNYLQEQEVKIKKRLITELMENLVLAYPELSHQLHIKPEYFMYETMLSRARLFLPMIFNVLKFMQKNEKTSENTVLNGYLKALKALESEGKIRFCDGYVKLSSGFIKQTYTPKTRMATISRMVPRAFFSPILGAWFKMSTLFFQSKEILQRVKSTTTFDSTLLNSAKDPEQYVFIPTASGLVPLASQTSIEAGVKEILAKNKNTSISIRRIGGILNDVYLAKAKVNSEETKIVVKRFKEWSSFKWFPLTIWGLGTKTFTVSSLRRMEKECSINQHLYSKGLKVPKILHISPRERLIFMEYVEGENTREIIKRLTDAKEPSKMKKELKIIQRIGKKMAKIHASGITLGDTKPENIMIGKNTEIIFMDFEQASRGGDKVWDIAEFLYYAGHDMPPLVEPSTVELFAKTFITGYLEAGGKAEDVRKAAKPKYTKVFSLFTLPHIMLATSKICRNTKP